MTEIAVTGIGVISSLGVGRDAFWEGVRTGRSGIKRITRFDTAAFQSNIAAWIDDFHPEQFMPPRSYRRMSPLSRMAVAAAVEAIGDSGINLGKTDRERIAVIMGTAYGSSSMVDEFFKGRLREGPRGAHPFIFPETVPNAPASHIAIFLGINGPNSTFCQNALSGESAIMYARNLLLRDCADVVLVGGADEISKMEYSCYDAVLALNRVRVDEGDTIRPLRGGGLVLGEGAGVLVMERAEDARRRDARIYGLLRSGIITGGIAAINRYECRGDQAARAMIRAMEEGGVSPDDIDQIDSSANYSRELDAMEAAVLRRIFGKREGNLAVSPLKYRMGDFGGAGTVRAAAVLLSMHAQVPLPAIAVDFLDDDVSGDLQWHVGTSGTAKVSLMTSSTFGGANSGLIFTTTRG
jgi:3-oxoacyl-[acyl-carrier-protein] synthase II